MFGWTILEWVVDGKVGRAFGEREVCQLFTSLLPLAPGGIPRHSSSPFSGPTVELAVSQAVRRVYSQGWQRISSCWRSLMKI